MSAFLLSQIFALVAFLFGVTSYQFKDRRRILICWTFMSAFISVHYFFLDRPGPGVVSFVSGIRHVIAMVSTDRRLMNLFLILTCGSFFWVYQTPLSFLALFASVFGTCASFQTTDRSMRILQMVCTAGWGIHNALAGTPVATLMEACFLTSNTFGYWRHYGQKRSPKSEVDREG